MRVYSKPGPKRYRRELSVTAVEHRGKQFVPLYYLLGAGLLVGASAWTAVVGNTYYVAAFLLPWAGFFWAKMFFWREVLGDVKGKK
jgi:hypothetical protein